MDEPSIETAVIRLPGWAGPLVTAVAGLAMLGLSWRQWPDVLVDYGQQLYLAWQMAEGRTLYADLVCNYGPLAAYLNAWVFQLGGDMMAMVGMNLVVFAGIASLLYWLLLRIGSRFSAMVGGLLLMLVFGFSQLTLAGNFNFATPYENSLTVGLLAALAALCLALRYLEQVRAWQALASGVCLGLAFLTKPEVFLAGLAGVGVAGVATAWSAGWGLARSARGLGLLGAGLGLPILVSLLALSSAMPVATAWSGTLGSWSALAGSSTGELLFYRSGMGTDRLGENLAWLTGVAAIWLGLAVVAVWLGRLGRNGGRYGGPGVAALVAGLVLATALLAIPWPLWRGVARPLPLAMLVLAGRCLLRLRRVRGDAAAVPIQVARLAFAAFAAALLLKMILNVRIGHYGFALAMPAVLLVATALTAWLPAWVQRRGGAGLRTAGFGLGVLAAFAVVTMHKSTVLLSYKTVSVGAGGDRMLADDRGEYVNAALDAIRKLPGRTLAVFPEGSILNYLTRRANPTPFYNYMPTGFSIFGEAKILQSLQAAPPDLIALVEKDTSEFGFRYFSRDYAQQTGAWLQRNYVIAKRIGEVPFGGQGFGILVLRRRQ